MRECILAVDGGGEGFRPAYVIGTEVKCFPETGPVNSVDELLDFVRTNLTPEVIGIAYAIAGEIEEHNKMNKSPSIHLLDGVVLGDLTKEKLGKPAVLCNDMEAAVMGMAALFPDLSYFMGITWSSGIGLRFFQDGKILAQSEGGHIPLDPSPYAPRDGCGVRGCAESILGGKNIGRRVIAETQALGIVLPSGVDPCQVLDKDYDKREDWAMSIYDLISTGMASFLTGIVTTMRPPVIVWKGTFAENALPKIAQDIRLKMRKKLINPDWAGEVKFEFSPKPKEDALIGAARLFKELT